eukprot:4191166-Pyramimonas_sp.AAC.1
MELCEHFPGSATVRRRAETTAFLLDRKDLGPHAIQGASQRGPAHAATEQNWTSAANRAEED